jgi:hypothetical protein
LTAAAAFFTGAAAFFAAFFAGEAAFLFGAAALLDGRAAAFLEGAAFDVAVLPFAVVCFRVVAFFGTFISCSSS